jgi:hypothetical protein
MKAILEFNLPDDQAEFDEANNAGKYYSILWDLDQFLRNKVKYPAEDYDPIETDTYDKVRTELWNLLNEHNIDLNK